MELVLFDKIGNCYLIWKRERRKLKKIKKKEAEESKKAKQLVHGSSFKSEETFNREDNDFLFSKGGLVAIHWKDSKVLILLPNCMDPSKLTSAE